LKQAYYNIKPEEKFSLLVHFLKKYNGISLIFCATREEVDLVSNNLIREGFKAMAIHGGLTQGRRLQVVDMLKSKKINTLVATDVAARGLDVKDVTHVFNYDVPKSPDEYVHRIGRTARAGESGEAITLLVNRDYDNFGRVLSDRSLKIEKGILPQFTPIKFDRGMRQKQGGFGGGHGGGRSGGFGGGRSGGFGGSRGGGHGHGHRVSEGRYNGHIESDGESRSEGSGHQGRNFTNHHGRSDGDRPSDGPRRFDGPRRSDGPRRDNRSDNRRDNRR
jgi:ATP-dependent RNA helicase DeaD